MKKIHGNSLENGDLHHLYQINDLDENDVFKYGISGEPLLADGSSPRANKQVNLFNLIAQKIRFSAKVLKDNISGRENALKEEQVHIEEYEKKNGRKPRGN
jgi:hypothetical protein